MYYLPKEKNGLFLIPLIIAWKIKHISKHHISILAGNVPFPGAQAWRWRSCNLPHPWQDRRYHPPKHSTPSLKAGPSLYLDPGWAHLGWAGVRGQCPSRYPQVRTWSSRVWQWTCRHGASQARAQLAGRLCLGGGLGASFVQHLGELASKSIWEISV